MLPSVDPAAAGAWGRGHEVVLVQHGRQLVGPLSRPIEDVPVQPDQDRDDLRVELEAEYFSSSATACSWVSGVSRYGRELVIAS